MPVRTHLDRIQRLEPEADHERIVYLMAFHEFPWDMTRALELALFRTFAVPAISAVLAATREFVDRPQKRYDDTDLILSEILEHGYDSSRGRAAIRRMNQLHGRFDISNEDFLYVLSTFVFEPIRWIDRYGWRATSRHERLAQYWFWRHVGTRMAIRDIPPSYSAFEDFNRGYEERHFTRAPDNAVVGEAVRGMFLGWVMPRPLHRVGEPWVNALMDPPLLAAMGFPEPGATRRRLVRRVLRARAGLVGLLPERKGPRLRTRLRRPTYPDGYELERLGPDDAPRG